MPKLRPYILTIAGFDPSGGAGILADVKTFEQCRCLGLAVNTAQTLQTEDTFYDSTPIPTKEIEKGVITLLERYPVKGIKIGWMEDWSFLLSLVQKVKEKYPKVTILWDPIAKASASKDQQLAAWEIADQIIAFTDIITPNYDELCAWAGDPSEIANWKSRLPEHLWVLQKGGHHPTETGRDFFYKKEKQYALKSWGDYIEKHGTGCIYSSALLALWVQDYPPLKAALKAKQYLKKAVFSNASKLAYHH